MLESLYRHLQIPVPKTALLVLTDVFETNPDYFYAVQASEAVIGGSSLKAVQDQGTVFDQEAYVSQVFGALLTSPSDGSFKNFKYSPIYHTLISIDNDLVFKPELTGKDDEKIVNVKSILYLLPQIDLPIPESIRTFFTSLDPHLLTLQWLQDLTQKNQEYQLLFAKLAFQRTRCLYQNLLPQSETPSLPACLQQKVSVDPELHGDSFCPQVLLSKDLLICFIEKLRMIEKTLLTNRSVSTQIIFEEISPILGKYYRKLRFEFNDSEEALEALWGIKKNDVDYSCISSLLDGDEGLSSTWIITELDETPETFFRGYKERLMSGQQSPLDEFIRRHSQRKRKNILNLRAALNELRLLTQEGLTHSQSIMEIVDFCHSLSKIIDNDPNLIKEITSLLSNLPYAELRWLLTVEKYFSRPDRSIPHDLIPSSTPVLGTFMKKRTFILTESENKYLFDQKGNIKKNASLTGRSRVACFPQENPEFYLKQYPEWPGYEFASTLFMRLLGIQHLPYQDLIIINSKYPALLTQSVHGDSVFRIWHNAQAFHNLDPVHTGLLIISAMLINPEDGKEDNFILSSDGKYLIPIDNDHCFLPSFFQKGGFWNAFTVNTALQTKTILFCLDEMYMSIPLEVKQHILSIDFDLLLTKWLTEVDKLENKFNNLVDSDQRKRFLEQDTVMRIPFYKQFIHNVHWKAHKIQEIFKVASSGLVPFDVLKTIEPFAAKCYEDSFKVGYNLQTRFKAATDNIYNKVTVDGSRVSILNTRTMMEIINVSEKDLQKDIAFQKMGPLDSLELLSRLIQEHREKVRREQEMLCELDDKNHEKKWINLFGAPPGEAALKAFLANPKEGLVLKGSKLIVSTKLMELFAHSPDKGMKIRFLSLPESPLLTEKEIRILAEDCPNIEYLNVSSCEKLTKIITAEGEWPLLARLEARDCLNLEKFVSYSPIKILRIETDQEVEIFVHKATLDIFTISKKEIGFDFFFKEGERFEIKSQGHILSNNFLLRVIRGKEEVEQYLRNFQVNLQIPSILSGKFLEVFTTSINLKYSNINIGDIQRFSLLNLINLQSLNFSQNELKPESLKYLIQGKWPKLNHLDLSENQGIHDEGVEMLIGGNWPSLETLNLSKTNMTAVGVGAIADQSKWPQLKHLDLSGNEIHDEGLQILTRGNWPLLESLNLNNSQITKKSFLNFVLNIKWSNLKEVHFDPVGNNAAAKNLLQKNWHLLERLDLSNGEIAQNEIETIVSRCNWPQLKYLDLSGNEIHDEGLQILTQGNWPLLEALNLNRSGFSKKSFLYFILNVKWSNLKEVHFDPVGNNAAAKNLLQKNWHLLERLDLSNGEITQEEVELIVKRCSWPRLKYLDLSNNGIHDAGLESLASAKWPLLEDLSIQNISMTTKGVEVFIRSRSNWPHLKRVNFSHNPIQNEGLNLIVSSNWTPLEYLNLEKTEITDEGIEILIIKAHWSNLKELDVSSNKIQDEGLKALSSGKWPLLESLYLRKLKITGNGIKSMTTISQWPSLKNLDLSDNYDISWEESDILKTEKWPLLEYLNVENTGITEMGIEDLLTECSWHGLKEIHFKGLDDKTSEIDFQKPAILQRCPYVKAIISQG